MKTAIVLEGGASRSLFGVGVTDVLLENGIYPDLAVGSSAGIANGVSYVSRQGGRAKEIAITYTQDKRYMGTKYLFKKGVRSLYNIPFVFEEIPNKLNLFDYETFSKSKCKSYACVTNVRTGKDEYLLIDGKDKTWKATVATCSLPIAFPPAEINGELYMDGGISASVPVDFAIDYGCEKIICVLTRERSYTKDEKEFSLKIASLFYKKYPQFANTIKYRNIIYNENRKHLFELEKQGKILIIAPNDTKGFKRTEKRPNELNSIYQQGRQVTTNMLDEIKQYLKK